ncbi:MAG: TRAM domain-containing protein [Treponema sp.]|nr:TRAM domain-containing protein [Treponema sp.]
MSDARAIRLRIEKLVAGGDGLAFHEGRAVFVPLALPGETVEARVDEARRDYAKAELLGILEPSPRRVDPPCPIYAVCGGCNLQHLDYPAQVEAKALILEEAFRRTGRMDLGALTVLPSPPFGYRNRLQLHVAPGGGLGFMRRSGNEVVEAPSCPIAVEALRAWIEEQARLRRDAGPASATAGSMPGSDRSGANPRRAGASGAPRRGAVSEGDDGPSRFVVFGSGDKVWVERGEAEVAVAGEQIRFRVDGFFQSNLRLLEFLVPRLLEGLSGEKAADLYCGVGLFSRFLGRRFAQLTCVEREAAALELARRNVPGHAGARREFAALGVEDWVRGRSAEGRFDCVLADPPRTGLSASVRSWMTRARIPALLYLSCDPVTMARDVGELTRSGYTLESLEGLDFYPQTSHLESFARLAWRG